METVFEYQQKNAMMEINWIIEVVPPTVSELSTATIVAEGH